MNKASERIRWAIFCKLGWDVRGCDLSQEQAASIMDGKLDVATVAGAMQKRKASAPKQAWDGIYAEAHAAGMAAGRDVVPVPMVVQEHANPLDDRSPVVRQYAPVMDGCCGFASFVIRPATGAFVKWLKSKGLGYKHYYGGWAIPCHEFNQSLTRKEAYCSAACQVLAKHGIKASVDSRMD